MDWNQVEGNWKQVKGKIKEQWGKLTDDDLDDRREARSTRRQKSGAIRLSERPDEERGQLVRTSDLVSS
ncbi:hypothetical protein ABIF66_010879 [Bradyrhizobium japonicum]